MRIARQAPTYAPSHWDPNARRAHLSPHASRYEVFHEFAHREQQAEWTLAWRTHRRLMHSPWLCRFSRLVLEWEAARMALRAMREAGEWTYSAEREARAETAWYFASIFVSEPTATRFRKWLMSRH